VDINKPRVFYSLWAAVVSLAIIAVIGDVGAANLSVWAVPLFFKAGGTCFGVSLITLVAEFSLYFVLGLLYCYSEFIEKIKVVSIMAIIFVSEILLNNLLNLSLATMWLLFMILMLGYPLGLYLGKRIVEEHFY